MSDDDEGGRAPVAGPVIEPDGAGGIGRHSDEEVDCEDALHRIYHFLDGALTEERRHSIEVHLDSCGPCVEAFGFEAELRRVVADRCRDHVPEHLRQRIAQALDHERVAPDRGGS